MEMFTLFNYVHNIMWVLSMSFYNIVAKFNTVFHSIHVHMCAYSAKHIMMIS